MSDLGNVGNYYSNNANARSQSNNTSGLTGLGKSGDEKDKTNGTEVINNPIDAIYEKDDKGVKVDDFLQLMIQQLQNQDFMEPMDDTQYLTQLAQFATMQQMEDLAYNSKSNYVMSLVGKEVTCAKVKLGGDLEKVTGRIDKIALYEGEYKIYIGDKAFDLNQIMEIHETAPEVEKEPEATTKIEASDITSTSADLKWDNLFGEEYATYTVYYSTSKENMNDINGIKGELIYGDKDRPEIEGEEMKNLAPNTTYYVNVVAKNSKGEEKIYETVSFSTPINDDQIVEPPKPEGGEGEEGTAKGINNAFGNGNSNQNSGYTGNGISRSFRYLGENKDKDRLTGGVVDDDGNPISDIDFGGRRLSGGVVDKDGNPISDIDFRRRIISSGNRY